MPNASAGRVCAAAMASARLGGGARLQRAAGALRIIGVGRFFADVAFAGMFMFLVVWAVHGLMFRSRASRMHDDTVERVLANIGEAIRRGIARLVGGGDKPV